MMFNKKQVSYVVWALGNHIGTITKRTKNEELAAIRQSLTRYDGCFGLPWLHRPDSERRCHC